MSQTPQDPGTDPAVEQDTVMVADVEGVGAAPARRADAVPFVGGLVAALDADEHAFDGLELPTADAEGRQGT